MNARRGKIAIVAVAASIVVAAIAVARSRYREVACIVAGRSATTAIVAAAPPSRWGAEAPTIERAITSFTT